MINPSEFSLNTSATPRLPEILGAPPRGSSADTRCAWALADAWKFGHSEAVKGGRGEMPQRWRVSIVIWVPKIDGLQWKTIGKQKKHRKTIGKPQNSDDWGYPHDYGNARNGLVSPLAIIPHLRVVR